MNSKRISNFSLPELIDVLSPQKTVQYLRRSIGVIFVWFGMLKFFDGLSPAQNLAIDTINILTFDLINDLLIIVSLATLEVIIGIGLLFKVHLKLTLFLLFFQMVGTFMPIFILPSIVFTEFPYGLTLEGQYIIKNLVIVSAAIAIHRLEAV